VLVLLMLMAVIEMSYSATSDVSPLLLRRVLRSPQSGGENTNTRIFFNNGNANSAAAGALFGGLISYAQNQVISYFLYFEIIENIAASIN